MSNTQQSQIRTRMFARVIGPYLVIVTATAVARASQMQKLASEFSANTVWPWVTGAFVLLTGLVVIGLHPYWRGAPAIIVSILGWLTALKGLTLLAFPQSYVPVVNSAVDAPWWRIGFVLLALVGLYLSYVGWAPARTQPSSQSTSSTRDLPRAA